MRHLSAEALGLLADVDGSTISLIERGLRDPRPETVVRLARALGVGAKRLQAMIEADAAEAKAEASTGVSS